MTLTAYPDKPPAASHPAASDPVRDLTAWHVGGEDVHLRIPLLRELRRRGFHVGAVGSGPAGPFERAAIPYQHYDLERGVSPLGDRRSCRQLIEIFVRHRPDVVHAFDTKPAILAMFAARQAQIAVRVRTITGMGHLFSANSPTALLLRPIYRRLQRRASRAASLTVFQNRDDRAYFQEHDMVRREGHELILGSGVDIVEIDRRQIDAVAKESLRRDLGLGAGPVVTMVSRLVKEKGVLDFLKAARAVRRSLPEAVFLLVGPVTSEGRQGVATRELTGSADVRWLGERRDVPVLLSLSDVFVLPSYYREGIPRVLLEAAAAGLPLITTSAPGCREVVRHGWNGLLVPPRDPSELSTAIQQLLRSPEDRAQKGRNSKEYVRENFSLEKVADAYAEIYRRLEARSGEPPGRGRETNEKHSFCESCL